MIVQRKIPTCSYCHIPHADHAEICLDCTALLRSLLGDSRRALLELETTLTRQARIGQQNGRGGKGSSWPLPFSPEASEAADVLLAGTITRWALDIWRASESPLKSRPPADPIGYIADRVEAIRFRGYAAALLDELQAALDNAWATVDLPAEYLEAGQCDQCSTRLVGRPDQATVTCGTCGAGYDIADRQAQMVISAEAKLMPAKQIERLVDIFLRTGLTDRITKRIPSGSVRGWASKGDLIQRGLDADGKTPTYRVGDVFDRAYREVAEPIGRRRAA